MRRALITGITGQTGSYLGEELESAGWEVHGIVRDADELEPELRARSPRVRLHAGDLADAAGIAAVVETVEPHAVFNLGGLSSVAASWDRPLDYARITGLGPAIMLDAALRLQQRLGREVAVVQASSAEIFGAAGEVPQRESTPIRPANPYGAAKAYGHLLVGAYRGAGLPASGVILYNHESPRRPTAFVTRKITSTVAAIARGRADVLTLGNLDAERDWGWAPDYARGLRLVAEHPAGDVVLATGETHTVRDFVRAAFAAAGIDDWERHVRTDPAFVRTGDPPRLVGDPSRARQTLGWSPSVGFDELVGRMVQHDLDSIDRD